MEPKNYKVYSDGIYEIITADSVQYMPATGQTCFFLNGEMLHIAPANVMITNTNEQDSIKRKHQDAKYKIQKTINELLKKRDNLDNESESSDFAFEIYTLSIKLLIDVRDEFLKE